MHVSKKKKVFYILNIFENNRLYTNKKENMKSPISRRGSYWLFSTLLTMFSHTCNDHNNEGMGYLDYGVRILHPVPGRIQ